MIKIQFPIAFLDMEGLEQRWQCGLGLIQTMAETEKIHLFLRPVVLDLALANSKISLGTKKKLCNRHLDYRDIYLLFKDKNSKIPIRGFEDMNTPPIYAEFCDLIIPFEAIEDFEHIYCDPTIPTPELQPLSEDFTCFLWRGREYKFGEMQARVIKRLWQARENGSPWVYGKYLLTDAGSGSNKLQSIFNHNQDWRNIILSDHKGKYRLNLPPKIMA